MSWSFLGLALISGSLAIVSFYLGWGIFAVIFILLFIFFGCLAFNPDKDDGRYVLTLGGVRWTEADFCRGWEIDGRTGSGKTASGVVPIIHALKANRPNMGILALDTKGDLSEPIRSVADELGCESDIRQLEVRPDHAPPDWKPPYTINVLADPFLFRPMRNSWSMSQPPQDKRVAKRFSRMPLK